MPMPHLSLPCGSSTMPDRRTAAAGRRPSLPEHRLHDGFRDRCGQSCAGDLVTTDISLLNDDGYSHLWVAVCRCERDKPGEGWAVWGGLGGTGLAGDLHAVDLAGGAGAVVDDVDHHLGELIGDVGRHRLGER